MIATLTSEWIKLRTVRMNWVLGIIAVAFPLLIVVLTMSLQDVDEINALDLVGLTTGTSVVTALLLGVIGSTSIAGEFGHGTIRPTFAATPQRSRVLVAKAIVTVLFASVIEAIVVALCLAIGSGIASSRGADFGVFDEPGNQPAVFGVIAFSAIVTLLGYGLGLVTRSTPAAVSILVLWPLVVEGLVAGLLSVAGVDEPFKLLPYNSGINMADPEPITPSEELSRFGGGLYFAVVTLAVVGIGMVITNRRDA